MFVTADQLLCHAIGDYVAQSDWMAINKTTSIWPALIHCLVYACVFGIFLCHSWSAFGFIFVTHFFIDHYRLARYVVFIKNFLAPPGTTHARWSECKATGYPPDRPQWLTVWLLIIADNVMHVICNAVALKYL